MTGFTPLVDVHETEEEYLVKVDVPGVKADDVNIEVNESVLSISGSRVAEETGQAQLVERPYGSFVRTLTLPQADQLLPRRVVAASGPARKLVRFVAGDRLRGLGLIPRRIADLRVRSAPNRADGDAKPGGTRSREPFGRLRSPLISLPR